MASLYELTAEFRAIAEKLEESDLPPEVIRATIRANQTVAMAVIKFDGNIFEQGLGPKLHGDIRCGQHG